MEKLIDDTTKSEILKGLKMKFQAEVQKEIEKLIFTYKEREEKIKVYISFLDKTNVNNELSKKESFMIKNVLLRKIKAELKLKVGNFQKIKVLYFEILFTENEINVIAEYYDNQNEVYYYTF